MDAVLGVIALAPEMPGHEGAVKQELVVSRIAQRLAIKEETVWARLKELRAAHHRAEELARRRGEATAGEKRQKRALPRERQLLQILLAEPALVAVAARSLGVEQIEHPGLRRLLTELYALVQAGETPDLDALRVRVDNPALMDFALRAQEVGLTIPDRAAWLDKLLAEFHNRRVASVKEELQNQLQAANDHREAVELLRQLQIRTVSPGPTSPPLGEAGLGRGGL